MPLGGSIIITSNLPFDEWTEVFGTERPAGALLDRLTHHLHILEMNGESYRLKRSRKARQKICTSKLRTMLANQPTCALARFSLARYKS